MALIKEPYGLVYNTDGSLCVTYRDDDIPFAGVRSFAVETSTTNLIQNPQFATGDFSGWTVNDSEYFELDEGHKAKYSVKSLPNDTGSFKWLRQDIPTTIGQTYTISFWIKYSVEVDSNYRFYVYLKSVSAGNIRRLYSNFFDGQWHKVTYTFIAEYDDYYLHLESSPNRIEGLSWISDIQLEQKSYSTSFVDGSRMYGKIVIENMQELEYDNFVFTCWANFRRTFLDWQFLATIFTPDESLDYQANHYSIRYRNSNNTIFLDINSYDFGTENIGNINLYEGWHFFLIAVHDGYTDFWIDNNKYTSSKYVMNSKDKNIYLGTWYSDGFHWQNTIANVFVGKYKKPNGTVIWTDDYIREVYEAKISFSAQNKLSIY